MRYNHYESCDTLTTFDNNILISGIRYFRSQFHSRFIGTPTGSRTTQSRTTQARTTQPRTTQSRTTLPRMQHIL